MSSLDFHSASWRAAALVAISVVVAGETRAAIGVGDRFPPLAGHELSGEVPATEGKMLVIDFFASWCAPCKASFPALSALQRDFAERGVVVIGIGVDEQPAKHTAFVKKMAPSFATLHDAKQQLVRGVDVPTMPTTFVVGRDGRVRAVHRGFHGAGSARELRALVESVLKESALSTP